MHFFASKSPPCEHSFHPARVDRHSKSPQRRRKLRLIASRVQLDFKPKQIFRPRLLIVIQEIVASTTNGLRMK